MLRYLACHERYLTLKKKIPTGKYVITYEKNVPIAYLDFPMGKKFL